MLDGRAFPTAFPYSSAQKQTARSSRAVANDPFSACPERSEGTTDQRLLLPTFLQNIHRFAKLFVRLRSLRLVLVDRRNGIPVLVRQRSVFVRVRYQHVRGNSGVLN